MEISEIKKLLNSICEKLNSFCEDNDPEVIKGNIKMLVEILGSSNV